MTEFVDAGECAIEVITRKEWNREYADGNAVPKGVKVVLLSAMGEPLLAVAGTHEALELFVEEVSAAVSPTREWHPRDGLPVRRVPVNRPAEPELKAELKARVMEPLTQIAYDEHLNGWLTYCRDHGNVTPLESGFTMRSNVVTQEQAELYRRRHLAKHLAALSSEISEASR